MRLPRFRVRVRTLLLAVGLAAVLVWGAKMGTRSYAYYERARKCDLSERRYRDGTLGGRRVMTGPQCYEWVEPPELAEYYATLGRKYRRAMHYPWLPVAPDPPIRPVCSVEGCVPLVGRRPPIIGRESPSADSARGGPHDRNPSAKSYPDLLKAT
jgi:hypothetical protein